MIKGVLALCLICSAVFFTGRMTYAECRVIEYPDHSEVDCSGIPIPQEERVKAEKEQEEAERKKATETTSVMFKRCTNRISDRLKSPASANYQFTNKSKPVHISNGDPLMYITVDAQNGYGALIRGYYICRFDNQNNVSYIMEDEHPEYSRM